MLSMRELYGNKGKKRAEEYIYIYVIGVISTLFDIVTDVAQALGRQKSSS